MVTDTERDDIGEVNRYVDGTWCGERQRRRNGQTSVDILIDRGAPTQANCRVAPWRESNTSRKPETPSGAVQNCIGSESGKKAGLKSRVGVLDLHASTNADPVIDLPGNARRRRVGFQSCVGAVVAASPEIRKANRKAERRIGGHAQPDIRHDLP